MRRPPAALIRAVLGDTATATLLLIVACGPALAAVDTHCEVHAGVSAPSTTDVDMLAIELVDHGDAGTLPVGPLDADSDRLTSRPQAAIDATILRQIFDETVPDEVEEPAPASTAPLAEVAAPSGSEERPALIDAEDSDELTDENDLPNAIPRVPGVSDDDMRRYRERMYRTDI